MAGTNQTHDQTIEVPLPVGSRVVIYDEPEIETVDGRDEGMMTSIMYEGYVEQYVPSTALLRMSDGTGLAEMKRLIDEGDGVEIILP